MNAQWPLQEAKNRLSQVVEQACTSGPQTMTLRGRAKAVVLSVEEYRRLTQRSTSLTEFLRHSPLYGLDLERERNSDRCFPSGEQAHSQESVG